MAHERSEPESLRVQLFGALRVEVAGAPLALPAAERAFALARPRLLTDLADDWVLPLRDEVATLPNARALCSTRSGTASMSRATSAFSASPHAPA